MATQREKGCMDVGTVTAPDRWSSQPPPCKEVTTDGQSHTDMGVKPSTHAAQWGAREEKQGTSPHPGPHSRILSSLEHKPPYIFMDVLFLL